VVGVVLGDWPNHYEHIASVFSRSEIHEVQQLWAVLKAVLKADKKLENKDKVQHVYF